MFALNKFFLCLSLFGIFLLVFLIDFSDPVLFDISVINDSVINDHVCVQGFVFRVLFFEDSDFSVVSLKDSSGIINVVVDKVIVLDKGSFIRVCGLVTLYKNELQINADKVFLKN